MRKLRYSFVVLLVVLLFSNSVFAGTIKSCSMTYYVDLESSRSMLNLINDWRQSGEAWYWNESDTAKVQCGKLAAYTYDYNLEQIALQRAYEAAVSFSHTRPNGTDCFTCTYNGTNSYGECIACGYSTAAGTFEQWQENDYPHAGQGHRRAMIDPDYKAIGIAHVVYEGMDFWVQEYGFKNSGASATTATKGNKTGTVAVDTSYATFSLDLSDTFTYMPVLSTKTLPDIRGMYQTSSSRPGLGALVPASDLSNKSWKSSNTSVIVIENNTAKAVGTGSCKLTASATYSGKTYTYEMSVTVTTISLSNSAVTITVPNCSFDINGNTPKPTIKYSGTTLVEGKDYTVDSYMGNTVVTTSSYKAYVTVKGKGNFSGSKTVPFEITATDINGLTISSIPSSIDYTGYSIVPDISISQNGTALKKGTHFSVSCTDNINPGTATVTISGINYYTGTKTLTFRIKQPSVANLTVSAISNQTYTGSAITPSITIKNGTKTLVKGTDYNVTYSDNTEPGTASATITGIGNYTGTKTVTFTIVPKQMSSVSVSGYSSSTTYTGSRITFSLTVKSGSTTLTEGTDYTVSYSNNTNVGTGKITLTGKGKYYTGTREISFTINPVTASQTTCTVSGSYTYTGSAIIPEFTLKYKDITFTKGVDYTVTYSDNVEPGTGKINITGNSSILSGTATKTFYIGYLSITGATVESIPNQVYTGSAIQPAVVVKDGSKTLVKGTDYTVAYYQNTDITNYARATITGTGHYNGSITVYFKIVGKPMSSATISSISAQTYTGSALKPAVTVKYGSTTLTLNTDYTVTYTNNINAGTATVSVTGKGTYSGTKTATFTISGKSISSATVSSISNQAYTGSAIKPSVTVKDGTKLLTSGTDYTVSYSGNVNAGTATVTITGKGNYSGTKTATFKITAKSLSGATVSSISDYTYTGSAITPSVVVKDGTKTLTLNTDYTVSYSNNVNAGTATVTITGKGNYSGTRTTTFNIVSDTTGFTVSSIADQTYTGAAITPSVTVKSGSKTLTLNTDYTVSYSNNINVGTATVTIRGKGNYSGTKTVTFKIVQVTTVLTILTINDFTYTGSAQTPGITVRCGAKNLTETTEYTVSYSNNINAGQATVTVTGVGNYAGKTATAYFNILAKSIAGATISSIADKEYTGSAIKPSVTVKDGSKKLVSGTDYTVSYSNNVEPGTAKVTVKGKGNYTGSKSITFTITKSSEGPEYEWVEISKKWYLKDRSGNYVKGFTVVDGATYYMDETGVMQTGWKFLDGNWYYFTLSGNMLTGWQKINNVWYFLDASGKMLTGWQEDGGKWYYMDSSGAMLTGWQEIGGKWYYMNYSGIMQTGWQSIGGSWYYFTSSGVMQTGWLLSNGEWYYLKDSGAMATKWLQIGGKWYWFGTDGKMVHSTTIVDNGKEYEFDSNGICLNP